MSGRRLDRPTLVGLVVVGLAAAVLSFVSLTELGMRAGYPAGLAVLLPVAIDAQAAVAARAWLAPSTPDRARRYARGLALAAVAVSIGGNAGEHAMAAYTITAPWWVVVAVSAIPPAALAATAHLAALVTSTGAPAAQPSRVDQTADQQESAPTVDPSPTAVDPAVDPTALDASAPTVDPSPMAVDPAVDPVALDASAPTTKPPRRSMAQLRHELTEGVAVGAVDPTSANSIRTYLSCSSARARQLRDEYSAAPHLAIAR